MFQVDGTAGVNREMTREALDIILRCGVTNRFRVQGQVLAGGEAGTDVRLPETAHLPAAKAASADRRGRLLQAVGHAEAGRRERLSSAEPEPQSRPMSRATGRPWRIGAARTGRTPNRADWRLVREVFVADTDEEAWRLSVGGMMGRMMREYFLQLLGNFGFLEYLKHDPNVADSDVTPEYCARHNWLVGSPATVAEKLERIYTRGRRFRRAAGVRLRLCRQPAGMASLTAASGRGSWAARGAPGSVVAGPGALIGEMPADEAAGIRRRLP